MRKMIKRLSYLLASLCAFVAGFMMFLSPVSSVIEIGSLSQVTEIPWNEVYFPENGNGTVYPFVAFLALIAVGLILFFLVFFPRISRILEIPCVAIIALAIGVLCCTNGLYVVTKFASINATITNGPAITYGVSLAAVSLLFTFIGSVIKR